MKQVVETENGKYDEAGNDQGSKKLSFTLLFKRQFFSRRDYTFQWRDASEGGDYTPAISSGIIHIYDVASLFKHIDSRPGSAAAGHGSDPLRLISGAD
jgi:hypothetical protein